MLARKLNFKPTTFGHHRSGWMPVSTFLYNKLYNSQGIKFYDWADRVFKDKIRIKNKWIGIFHNVLKYPAEYPKKYTGRIFPLAQLVKQRHFRESLPTCEGIFTLSEYTANFIRPFVKCQVCALTHPVLPVPKNFKWGNYTKDKKVVTIGQWLRKYHSISKLKTEHRRILLKTANFDSDYKEMLRYANFNNIEIRNYMPNDRYDNMLASCVVFLDLYDVAACNVVLECIIRNTPILINHHPANIEYLGADYPLFYSNLDEASEKINSDLVYDAHVYLSNMDKTRFSLDDFLHNFTNSNIYQEILC